MPCCQQVESGVLSNRLQTSMWYGSVPEATGNTCFLVNQPVVVEPSREEPLSRDSHGHPAGVNHDPSSTPLLAHICRGATATGWVEEKVTRVGGHQYATLNDLDVG